MGRFRFRIKEHTIFYRTGLEPLDLEFRGLNRSNGDRDLLNITNSIIQESALEIKKTSKFANCVYAFSFTSSRDWY